MYKVLALNYSRCNGCRVCEHACSIAKTGNNNQARSRIHIVTVADGSSVPMVCEQCQDAPCIVICPTKALSKNEVTGLVNLDYEKCIFCKMCVAICPFGGMNIDMEQKRVIKCDLCEGNPACVSACQQGALHYIEIEYMNSRLIPATEKIIDMVGGSVDILP